jgi:hypothetical protein
VSAARAPRRGVDARDRARRDARRASSSAESSPTVARDDDDDDDGAGVANERRASEGSGSG